MGTRAASPVISLVVVAALALTGCGAGRIVASNADEAARAAASAMRQHADEAARSAIVVGDESLARQAVVQATDEAVRSDEWQAFRSQFAARVRVTRESEICQPVVDLVFAEDVEDVLEVLSSLSDEASSTEDAEQLYDDLNALIEIWQTHDPAQPAQTYVAVATALFQDFYCVS